MVKFASENLHNAVDLQHNPNEIAKGVSMFESYIVNKENGIYPLHLKDENISNGSWVASYKITDKQLWSRIKKGEFNGFSIAGMFDHSEKETKKQHKMSKKTKTIREMLFGTPKGNESFATATTSEGVELSYEGDLAVGTAVSVMVEGEQLPAPAGTYILTGDNEGKSIVIDESGNVAEIIDVPTDVPADDVAEVIDAIVEEMKATNKNVAKMEIEMASIQKENAKLLELNKELTTKVETFAGKTIVAPTTTFKKIEKNPNVASNPLLSKYLK